MKYSIEEQSDIETIVVIASGIINTDLAEQMVMDTGQAIKLSGFKKCFFDLTETEVDPEQTLTGMFMFISIFKKAGIDSSTRITALYVSGGTTRKQLEVGAKFEDFKLKHFTDRDEAFNWLNLT